MKNILVTGANGFIGSALCRRLVSEGAVIHGVSRKKQSKDLNIEWWRGDLTKYNFVESLFRSIKPDVVFHLASYVTGARDLNIVLPSYHAIATTTVNILHAATLFTSGNVIIAGSMEEPTVDEDGRLTPSSPYAAAKATCALYAKMYYALYRSPIFNPNIYMVYGPDQKDENKLIPYVINCLLKGEKPKLTSGIRGVDWIYIDDVVEGLIRIAYLNRYFGEKIDLGSGMLVPIKDIVTNIASIMECENLIEFGRLEDRKLETMNSADVKNTNRILGWKPTVDVKEGLLKTIEWYKKKSNDAVV
jgi:UDP-glucose 4-epimerase